MQGTALRSTVIRDWPLTGLDEDELSVVGSPTEVYPRRDDREVTVTADRLGVLGSYPLLASAGP